MSRKRTKPQGELVWVMDGKTEYMGQLIEPLSMIKTEAPRDEEDVELEVRWTHNGVIERVTLDRVRVESSGTGERRRASRNTSPKASPEEKKAASPAIKTKESPKTKVGEKSPKKSSQSPPEKSKKRTSEELEEKPTKNDGKTPSEIKADEPSAKKQKVRSGDTSSGANSFLGSLTSHVVGAKNAFVSSFQEVVKELMGSPSSSQK